MVLVIEWALFGKYSSFFLMNTKSIFAATITKIKIRSLNHNVCHYWTLKVFIEVFLFTNLCSFESTSAILHNLMAKAFVNVSFFGNACKSKILTIVIINHMNFKSKFMTHFVIFPEVIMSTLAFSWCQSKIRVRMSRISLRMIPAVVYLRKRIFICHFVAFIPQ